MYVNALNVEHGICYALLFFHVLYLFLLSVVSQKRRRPTTCGQLDDKRREMLKRHPLSLCLDLKCKGNTFYKLDVFCIPVQNKSAFYAGTNTPPIFTRLVDAKMFTFHPRYIPLRVTMCSNCDPHCYNDMTQLDPRVPSAGDKRNSDRL